MRMRPQDLNIAGAVDLSALRSPTPPAGSGPAPGAAPRPAAGPPPEAGALVFDVTDATFEDLVLRRSLQVPVLVDFWAEWCGPCKQLSPVLEKLANEGGGSWLLAKVDVDSNPQIAGQLQVQSIPTVVLALGGRLIQGFTGALPERDLRSFVEQVLAAAQQAGLPGPGAVDEDGEPAGPPLDPEVIAAEDALEQGDYAAAEAAYDALLARKPGDPMATAGRASIALFRRVEGLDAATVLAAAASSPDDVAAQLDAADLEIVADRVDEAVARLIGLVRRTAGDEREQVRTRLLELFNVLDPADPRVVTGRRSLANALF
jgi:putative thioredoxin